MRLMNFACYAAPCNNWSKNLVETIEIDEPLNVFGESLLPCSEDPMTGFLRDGCCNTGDQDVGSHTVCVQVSEEFLEYSRFAGNDLSTPSACVWFSWA